MVDSAGPVVPYVRGLHELAEGVAAFVQPPGSWGRSNAGFVVSGGRGLLVDTFYTLDLTRELLAAVGRFAPGAVVDTVVVTHPNGDHCWGNQLLPGARVVASRRCAEDARHEVTPELMSAMQQRPLDGPAGEYFMRAFGGFDFSGIAPVAATCTFTGGTELDVGGRTVELIEVGPAHTSGDVVAFVPDAGVVFAGDVLFIGDHPVGWAGPLEGWVAACDRLLATGAHTFVPGHGPVVGRAEVVAFRDYLTVVAEHGRAAVLRGELLGDAARAFPFERFPGLGFPERVVTLLAAVYRKHGVAGAPSRPLALLAAMAELERELAG